MGYRKVDKELDTNIDQYDASGGDNTWEINLSKAKDWGIQINWAALTGTLDGYIAIEGSMDEGREWFTYPGFDSPETNYVMSAISGTFAFNDEDCLYDKIRITFTANNITGGTIDIFEHLKSL